MSIGTNLKETELKACERIVFPVDTTDLVRAKALVDMLKGHVGMFKFGLEFFWAMTAHLMTLEIEQAQQHLLLAREVISKAGRFFVDCKLADIPNTVVGAAVAIARLGCKFLNVHASAGQRALLDAVTNTRGTCKVLGVTVLTSMTSTECCSVFGAEPNQKVLQFCDMILDAGAAGVICSPQELAVIRNEPRFNPLLLVTPGIRPEWAATGDQKRVMTPRQAFTAGADYIVCGRPISSPPEEIGGPLKATSLIASEIEQGLADSGRA
ncbi:orotidine-5'-phosphate decarboxylase [Patescibacteria group bacterium]|nr:orotidine-5'-phosphate decarboxylase [Patescibacteria group bacterium]